MDNTHYLLALNRMPQVGPKTIQKWLSRWPMLEELFHSSETELAKIGLHARFIHAITRCDLAVVEQDYAWMNQKKNRMIVTILDSQYPAALKEIDDSPPVLYMEGVIDALLKPKVAVIGTRNPTLSGLAIAKNFGFELARAGVTVVSGLARGIDGAAHQGCVLAVGQTIGVMGTGIDTIYPKQHTRLVEKITDNGLILTEFPLKTPPLTGHFPRRNRIISGLSLAVLVVESAVRSGSLLTARLALEQNREVMAVPGSVRNPKAAGCHLLLQQGAKLVTSIQDVLEDFSIDGALGQSQKKVFLAKNARKCLLRDMGDELVTVDELVVQSGRSVEDIICDLVELELDGVIQSLPGGYMRCIL